VRVDGLDECGTLLVFWLRRGVVVVFFRLRTFARLLIVAFVRRGLLFVFLLVGLVAFVRLRAARRRAVFVMTWRTEFFVVDLAVAALVELEARFGSMVHFGHRDDAIAIGVERTEQGVID